MQYNSVMYQSKGEEDARAASANLPGELYIDRPIVWSPERGRIKYPCALFSKKVPINC